MPPYPSNWPALLPEMLAFRKLALSYLLLGQLEKTVSEGMWTRRMASFFMRDAMARICGMITELGKVST